MKALETRNAASWERLAGWFGELARGVESLAMYSPEAAEEMEGLIAQETTRTFRELRDKLLGKIEALLQEKNDDAEDWDSSSSIHMLMDLKRRVEKVVGDGV